MSQIGQFPEEPNEMSFPLHCPVTNDSKPDKLDRAANTSTLFQGQSLNNNLPKRLHLLRNLTDIILRFKENMAELSTDVEQMFMQVEFAPGEKIWAFLLDSDSRINTYKYASHISGATESACFASKALRKRLVTKLS